MQTRWAWWAYNFDSAVIPAAGPVGAVQYNGDPYLAGEAAFSYDDVTNIVTVGSGVKINKEVFSEDLIIVIDAIDSNIMKLTGSGGSIFVGAGAGYSSDPDLESNNAAFGTSALEDLVSGTNNSMFGQTAGRRITTGARNVGVGSGAAYGVAAGAQNVYAGFQSGLNNVGDSNVGVGDSSLLGVSGMTDADENVGVGNSVLKALLTGTKNVIVGTKSGELITTGSRNILIGYDLDTSGITASDELNIGGLLTGVLAGTPGLTLTGTYFQLANGAAIRGDTTDAHTYKFSVYDLNTGPAYVDWCTVQNGNTPSVIISPPAGGTTITVKANTLAAVADVSGTAAQTTITNGTAAAGANAYVIQGGQAPATVNTGWVKIYVGTAAAWVPYWANATP